MNKKTSSYNYFNRIYRIPHFVLIRAVEASLVASMLDDNKEPVLDLGCGNGEFGGYLAIENLYGIDISEKALGNISSISKYKKTVIQKASDMPFDDNFFGTIFANCALEHMDEIDQVIKEITRVLKPGGELIFTVPVIDFIGVLKNDKLLTELRLNTEEIINKYNKIHHHVNIWDIEKWKDKVAEAGLEIQIEGRYLPEPFGSFVIRMDMLYTLGKNKHGELIKKLERKYSSLLTPGFWRSSLKYMKNPLPAEHGTHIVIKAINKL